MDVRKTSLFLKQELRSTKDAGYSVIPELRRQRQDDCIKFKASQSYTMRHVHTQTHTAIWRWCICAHIHRKTEGDFNYP